MSRVLAHTNSLTHEQWLALRRNGIGGSDAAAVCGLNPYVTPYTLWADKTGRLEPQPDNEAMRMGRDLEWYVAQRFEEETGKRVRRKNFFLQHDDYDFITANIDRDIVGENAGLECKTTRSLNLKRYKNGDFPSEYYAQCMHYMAVTGYQRWYLAVLVYGSDFKVFTIERDEDEINALIEAEREFWETYIVSDNPPPVDGFKSTSDSINSIFKDSDGGECNLMCENTVGRYMELKEQKSLIEKELERTKQKIMEEMKECETGYCGNYKVSWPQRTRNSVSKKLLLEAYPDIDIKKIEKTSEYRVFSISEIKKEKE